MTKAEAIDLFLAIQTGRGTGDLRTAYLTAFGAGSAAQHYWDDGVFTLGVEYGLLIALTLAYGLTPTDVGLTAPVWGD